MATVRSPRSRIALLLGGAFVLHNLEEALAFARMYAAIRGHWGAAPEPRAFLGLLAVATLLGLAMLAWAGGGSERPLKRTALAGLAWVLLLNILLPHVPAAVVLGGYAPGVATALLINLPVGLFALRTLRQTRRR